MFTLFLKKRKEKKRKEMKGNEARIRDLIEFFNSLNKDLLFIFNI